MTAALTFDDFPEHEEPVTTASMRATQAQFDALLAAATQLQALLAALHASGGLAAARDLATPFQLATMDRRLEAIGAIAKDLIHDPRWCGAFGRVDRRYR
jgi:uncharacterized protein YciW